MSFLARSAASGSVPGAASVRNRATSYQVHDPPPRLSIGLDVPLCNLEAAVTGQVLHVAEGAADAADLAGGVGDEGAVATVGRTADEAEVAVTAGDHVDGDLRGGAVRPLGRDHVGGPHVEVPALALVLEESGQELPQVLG